MESLNHQRTGSFGLGRQDNQQEQPQELLNGFLRYLMCPNARTCAYIRAWTQAKDHWVLTMDRAEAKTVRLSSRIANETHGGPGRPSPWAPT